MNHKTWKKFRKVLGKLSDLVLWATKVHVTLGELMRKVESLMALADDLKAGISKLNDETNVIAGQVSGTASKLDAVQANITQLAGRIKNSLTDQEVADIKSALGAVGTTLSDQSGKLAAESDRLITLAQDPTVPVPPPPAALTATRKK